jgi:tetratricopeptide (TPR) repeat protein
MKKLFFEHIISCFVLITLVGCNKSTTFANSSSNEYLDRFSQALISNDENFILSAIIYIDNLIESGGENEVGSIYYNKAQLLYKIKHYNKALETLYQTDDSAYDVQKASLLIPLGYQNQAMQLLEKATATNTKILIETSLPEHQKTLVLQGFRVKGVTMQKSRLRLAFSLLFGLACLNFCTSDGEIGKGEANTSQMETVVQVANHA